MNTLPYRGRCAFASVHPAVTFAFFAAAIVLCMVLANPIYQLVSAVFAGACYVSFRGRRAWRFVVGLMVVLLVVALASPLFNTQGATVLFRWWGERPYTMEALALGVSTGLMLVSMMLWFASYHLVMTSDKFTYLFGRAAPALSTILVMVLRLVPSYRHRAAALVTARACIGKGPSEDGPFVARVRDAGSILALLSADALEGAVVAADSMAARGFGLPGRTHFALFRWSARDTVLASVMTGLAAGAVIALVLGGTSVAYFPTIAMPPASSAALGGGLCYAALLALPVVVNLGGRASWRYSLSRG